MQLTNYFSEITKLIVLVSQQIDQWFHRTNVLKHDLDSTLTTPMLCGPVGGRKAYSELEGAPNTGLVVIQGARWIEQEKLAFGSLLLRGPKGKLNSWSWQVVAKRWTWLIVEELSVKEVWLLRGTWEVGRGRSWGEVSQKGEWFMMESVIQRKVSEICS